MFANLTPSPLCPRCGTEFDCLKHRLWDCHLNDVHIDTLCLAHGITRSQLSGLPTAMKRCGIPTTDTGLSDDQIIVVQDYLVRTVEYTLWKGRVFQMAPSSLLVSGHTGAIRKVWRFHKRKAVPRKILQMT